MPSIPGCLHPSNRNCIDWNCYGAIAYGSHNCLVIVDASTYRRIQTIEHHADAINNVCWAPSSSIDLSKVDGSYRIASSDIGGQIIVTEALSAVKRAQFCHASTTVIAMQWFVWKDAGCDFLLCLHSGSLLVLWNAESGEKIWSHAYSTYSLFDMVLDPFNSKHVTFISSGCSLLLTRDIHLNTEPFSNGYHTTLFDDSNKSTSIHCAKYHSAYRNSLFVLCNGQLCLYDTELCATLFKVNVEGNTIGLNPCSLRDAIFTVQLNGSVTLRVGTYSSNDDRADSQFGFDKICFSETLRHGAQQKVVASILCPVTQSTLAVLYNSGRIVFWQLATTCSAIEYRKTFIDDYLCFDKTLITRPVAPLSLHQSGVVGSLSTGVSCVRMRPMDELGKLSDAQIGKCPLTAAHVAAVGTHAGIVHLIDVFSSQIIKEFNVQSSPIKMMEWGGAFLVLTAGFNHALSTTHIVRNDLFATDIRTGLSRRIRPEADESPITLMRVSYYHCYLALAFQREPLEIWDLKGLRLLRRMSRTCPLIIDMAWSSKHHGMKTTETSGQSVYRENLVVLDSENRLYHVVVKGLHVKDGKEVNTQWKSGGWSIRNMAWKGDILAMGDADGRIAVWDVGNSRQSRHARSSRLPVLRMAFSRLAGDHTLAVLHQRELSLWDTDALTRTQQIVIDASRAVIDMDLCGISPIMITNDNVFRFMPSNIRNNPIAEKDVPVLMNRQRIERMLEEFDAGVSADSIVMGLVAKKISSSPGLDSVSFDLSQLKNESLISRFLGDLFVYLLLEIVEFSLSDPSDALLPPQLQLFWPNASFRERELRVTCAACTSSSVLESRLVERAVVAGGKAKDRAVDRLIGSIDLRHASMKAALLVSSQDSEQARSLIKLIATNLIASDMIEDGVELLFLVGAGADACKYLQSQKQWNKSVVYAKMGLENPDDVLIKWVAHLQDDDKGRFVMAQASRSEWPSVVEYLSSAGRSRLARRILRTTTSSPPSTHRASPASNVLAHD